MDTRAGGKWTRSERWFGLTIVHLAPHVSCRLLLLSHSLSNHCNKQEIMLVTLLNKISTNLGLLNAMERRLFGAINPRTCGKYLELELNSNCWFASCSKVGFEAFVLPWTWKRVEFLRGNKHFETKSDAGCQSKKCVIATKPGLNFIALLTLFVPPFNNLTAAKVPAVLKWFSKNQWGQ